MYPQKVYPLPGSRSMFRTPRKCTIVNRFILRGGLSYPPSCESEILPPYIPTPFVQERDPKSL